MTSAQFRTQIEYRVVIWTRPYGWPVLAAPAGGAGAGGVADQDVGPLHVRLLEAAVFGDGDRAGAELVDVGGRELV